VFAPEYTSVLRNAPALCILRALGIPVILRLGNAPDRGLFYRVLWRSVINALVDRFGIPWMINCGEPEQAG
jgi:hypothetical protein